MASTLPALNLPADFFQNSWQQQPVVLRNFLPGYQLPMTADDLAGLACMDDVEARMVLEQGGSQPWELRHGPFKEADFSTLPDSHWTLLVQAVDHWEDELAALRRLFPQIPNWRLDDVMVSYAADQGSVGPHVDQYDVFLLQGEGQRRWHLGGAVGVDAPLMANTDLRLLETFSTESEVLLEPGDALYLPPGYAHWGVAEGECITVSLGFRAPAVAEVIDAFAAHVADNLDHSLRYRDPAPLLAQTAPAAEPTHPGEITSETLATLLDLVQAQLTPLAMGQWFGRYATERKYPDPIPGLDAEDAQAALAAGLPCMPAAASRFAYVRRDQQLDLYVDGQHHLCPAAAEPWIQAWCDGRPVDSLAVASQQPELMPQLQALLLRLLQDGALEPETFNPPTLDLDDPNRP